MSTVSRRESFTVLIVDDDVDSQRLYGAFLSSKRCVVYYASDGRTGIDQAIEIRPDLIILDLAMPRVDGWTVLRQIRDSSWTADIPVLVLTGIGDVRDDVLRMAADACLLKPCPPDVVWCQIQGLFRAPSHLRSRLHESA
jgi:two-component system response regulator RpaA